MNSELIQLIIIAALLLGIIAAAKAIESQYGRTMDIAWAIDRDSIFPKNVFVVQACPETVWSQRETGPILGRMTGLQLLFGLVERGMKEFKIPC